MKTNIIDDYNEYEKYDIIDFMEIDYLEYLNSLPKDIWKKYKNDVEKQLLNVQNIQVINLVLSKIQLDSYQYIIKNFEKINLDLLKHLIKNDEKKIMSKIINNKSQFIFESLIKYHDLEFNKYIYENLYENLYENYPIKNINSPPNNDEKENIFKNMLGFSMSMFGSKMKNVEDNNIIDKNKLSITNEFKIIFENMSKKIWFIPKYFNVLEYYTEKLNLKTSIRKYSIDTKINLYKKMYLQYSINSYDEMIKLQNFFEISKYDFLSKVIFNKNKPYSGDSIINNICKTGDIDYFIKIINNFNFEKKYFTDNIIATMFYNGTLSKNINFIIVLYNYLKTTIQIDFNTKLLSDIVKKIVHETGSNHNQYDDIIYEFINLGAIIKGYGEYTEYIESIKFLEKKY
jgi:hypothetical protein